MSGIWVDMNENLQLLRRLLQRGDPLLPSEFGVTAAPVKAGQANFGQSFDPSGLNPHQQRHRVKPAQSERYLDDLSHLNALK